MLRQPRRWLLIGLAIAACSAGTEPVDPVWGKQVCDSCRMIVSDPAYAAELIDERGRRRFFDDIDCLDEYLVEHPQGVPRALWVRSGSRWRAAEFVRYAAGAASPMGYGFVPSDDGPLDFASVRRIAAERRRERRP
jgi:copper chaperone NosL